MNDAFDLPADLERLEAQIAVGRVAAPEALRGRVLSAVGAELVRERRSLRIRVGVAAAVVAWMCLSITATRSMRGVSSVAARSAIFENRGSESRALARDIAAAIPELTEQECLAQARLEEARGDLLREARGLASLRMGASRVARR